MKKNLKPPPYNPLDKTKLGESVANALLESPLRPLPPEPFQGAGVYAIYYVGDFPSYGILAGNPPFNPIYVGKAVPKGARKGHIELDGTSGDTLFQRLKEHSESVEEVGLGRSNFLCRYLVVDDIWIPLGESLLIRRFRPVWNVLLDGFGNHDPGGKRVTGKTSRWDMVHPGRSWVKKRRLQPDPKSRSEWLKEIETYLSTGESPDLVMEETIPYSTADEA
jgi:hypothetical protein